MSHHHTTIELVSPATKFRCRDCGRTLKNEITVPILGEVWWARVEPSGDGVRIYLPFCDRKDYILRAGETLTLEDARITFTNDKGPDGPAIDFEEESS